MTLTSVIDQAGESLGGFLPRVAGALVLLLVGWILAGLVGRLLTRVLEAAGVDGAADRFGVGDTLARSGLGRSLSSVLGGALRIGLRLVVLFAALSLLGLQFLSESLNSAVLFLPKLLVALLLLLAGVVVGALAREYVDRLTRQLDFPVPLGVVAQVTVVAVFALSAAAQVAVSTVILAVLVGILVAAAAATFALAFGLGGRDVARALSAGRYVREAYEVGQTISFGEVTGRVTAIEGAATVLEAPDGRTVRVPNHVLLEAIVRVEG